MVHVLAALAIFILFYLTPLILGWYYTTKVKFNADSFGFLMKWALLAPMVNIPIAAILGGMYYGKIEIEEPCKNEPEETREEYEERMYNKGPDVTTYDSIELFLRPIIAEALAHYERTRYDPEQEDYVGVAVSRDQKNLDPTPAQIEERDSALEMMLYAFTAEEPDWEDFNLNWDLVDLNEGGLTFDIQRTSGTDEDEEAYQAAVELHWNKVDAGYKLFGEYLHKLWW